MGRATKRLPTCLPRDCYSPRKEQIPHQGLLLSIHSATRWEQRKHLKPSMIRSATTFRFKLGPILGHHSGVIVQPRWAGYLRVWQILTVTDWGVEWTEYLLIVVRQCDGLIVV